MSDLREAAQQALEALANKRHEHRALQAISALRAALNAPQPEPVASFHRQPLSDEQIKAAVMDDPFFWAALMSMMRDGVMVAQVRDVIAGVFRAAEKAHGIGGDK